MEFTLGNPPITLSYLTPALLQADMLSDVMKWTGSSLPGRTAATVGKEIRSIHSRHLESRLYNLKKSKEQSSNLGNIGF